MFKLDEYEEKRDYMRAAFSMTGCYVDCEKIG